MRNQGEGVGLFTPFELREVVFANRIGISPMCMYSASNDGIASPWHLVHLGSRAVGGAGLVMAEATAVSDSGRGTDADLGIWGDEHEPGLAAIADFVSSTGAVAGIQLFHAGRKGGRTAPWRGHAPVTSEEMAGLLAPSPVPFSEEWSPPTEMSPEDIDDVVDQFAAAARRAVRCGFRVVELHFAHGYLVHQFLSPLTNHRDDPYGGDLVGRALFARRITRAVRGAVGPGIALFARLSVVDWAANGLTLEDSIDLATWLGEDGVDLIDCSSGAAVRHEDIPVGPMYQVPFSQRIRASTGMPTAAVGLIRTPAEAQSVVAGDRADLVLIGRASLHDPYWPRRAAHELGAAPAPPVPLPYRRSTQRTPILTRW